MAKKPDSTNALSEDKDGDAGAVWEMKFAEGAKQNKCNAATAPQLA